MPKLLFLIQAARILRRICERLSKYIMNYILTKPNQWLVEFSIFEVHITYTPFDMSYEHFLRENYDDRSVTVPHSGGTLWFHINHNGNSIGHAVISADEGNVCCDSIDVNNEFRRKGLATFIYDFAEDFFDRPAIPNEVLFPDGKKFWLARNKRN